MGFSCYTEKAPNAWHRRGTPKPGNTYHQPKRPLTGTTHIPSTRHYLKGSPGVKTHNTNQHSSRTRLQHSNHPPASPTPNSVTTRSSQPTQPLRSTGGLSRTTTQNTPRLRGDTQRPPAWAHSQEWLMDSQGRTASPKGGRGGVKVDGAGRRRGSGADERTGSGARDPGVGGGRGGGQGNGRDKLTADDVSFITLRRHTMIVDSVGGQASS